MRAMRNLEDVALREARECLESLSEMSEIGEPDLPQTSPRSMPCRDSTFSLHSVGGQSPSWIIQRRVRGYPRCS